MTRARGKRGGSSTMSRDEAMKELVRLRKEERTYDEIAEYMEDKFTSEKTGTPISAVGWRRNFKALMNERGEPASERARTVPGTGNVLSIRGGSPSLDHVKNILKLSDLSATQKIKVLETLLLGSST